MEKQILAAASFEKQKYFFSPEFLDIPIDVQEEVRVICILTAEKLHCSFATGFEEDGNIYFEIIPQEGDFDFDEIGAELEVKEIRRTKKELLKALQLWYVIFRTEDGQETAQKLILKENGKNIV